MTEETIDTIESRTVGQILKAEREKKELTLDSIAKILCISKRQLILLEEDDENLVCDVYTLGFLKSYSSFLGLDTEEMLEKFKDKVLNPPVVRLSFPAPLPGRGMPSIRILGLSICLLIAIIAGWEWYGYQGSPQFSKEDTLIVEAVPTEVEESIPQSYIPPAINLHSNSSIAFEEIISLTAPQPVLLTAKEEVWVEVKDRLGKVIVSRIFQPGETFEFKDPQDLTLKTGNVQGFELRWGEKVYTSPKEASSGKVDISLDPEKWLDQNHQTQ